MVNKLYEESNSKDNRIHELESKLEDIKSQLIDIERQFKYASGMKLNGATDENDIETTTSNVNISKDDDEMKVSQ